VNLSVGNVGSSPNKIIINKEETMNMKNKVILTDCDGVLLDWVTQFHDWMTSKGYVQEVTDIYDISTMYGIEKNQGSALVREFNESAWMGFLPAFRDARSGVARLVEAGYQFVVITSLSLDEKARLLRISNLKNIFGKDVFTDVICLDTGADKDDALSPYEGTGMYWLEDKAENAECGQKLGLKSILIEHTHNSDYVNDDIVRVANWAEMVDVIVND
jgi:hypothetical protein